MTKLKTKQIGDGPSDSSHFLAGDGVFRIPGGGGSGTVTSVSVTTANGVSGTVATATTTPAITLALGAITPSSVNSVVLSGSSTPTLAVTGTTTVSGSNTGDQTTISGNAGTATVLQTARNINGVSFNGSADITVTAAAGTLTGTTLNSTVVTSSLTAVGTIATGVWNATTIGIAKGGTGKTTIAANKFWYASATDTLSEATYIETAEAAYSGTVTFTGTTAPTTAANKYAWQQDGKTVTVWLWLNYTNAGTGITMASAAFPGDLPAPVEPTGFTATNDLMYSGVGGMGTSTSTGFANNSSSYIIKTKTGAYSIAIRSASNAVKVAYATISYKTA